MHRNQIVVLDPGTKVPELDCFNNIAQMANLPVTYHLPALFGMESLKSIPMQHIKGIIIFGSGCSVNDNLPWHEPFNQWLFNAMNTSIPTFGICYGHQLIAHLFGGVIDFVTSDHFKFSGFRNIKINEDQRLKTSKYTANVVVSHSEEVKTVPQNFSVWSFSPEIAIEGLAHSTLPIWSMQCHPEATLEFMNNQSMALPKHQSPFSQGHKIIQKFIEFIESSLATEI